MSQFANRLAALDQQWAAAPVDAGSGPPPPGDYIARVEKVLIELNERTKHLQLKTVLVVAQGDYTGRASICWHDLEDVDRFRYAKAHIATLGLPVEPLSTLETRLVQALDAVVEIRVKQSTQTDSEGRPYLNTYVNRLVQSTAARQAPLADLIVYIRALANVGRLEEAGRMCALALDQFRDNAELHYLHAVLIAQSGHHAESARAAKRALYLDRDMTVAHLALGSASLRAGDVAGARRAFESAERTLKSLPADATVPFSDGEPARRLLEMTRAQSRLARGDAA